MPQIYIAQLPEHVGSIVEVRGWIDTIRRQKTMQFIIVRDRTGKAQVAHFKSNNPELTVLIDSLTPESTVRIVGKVNANPQIKLNGLELELIELEVYSLAGTPLPITEQTDFDTALDWRYLMLRWPKTQLIFGLQTVIEHAMRQFWVDNGFLEIHSPKLLGAASENSGSELFSLPYFDMTAYLAQSPQFYKQMAAASGGFDRIFEIGPVFRANPSRTTRHDTEFTGVDMEMAWIDSHEDVMQMEERWLQHVLQQVAAQLSDPIHEVYGQTVEVPTLPFPRLTMSQARAIVSSAGYQIPNEAKGDLDPQAERIVSAYIKNHFGHDFVFVTHYPASVRAFYHMREENDPALTKSFDLLYRGLEITTGAQREHRIERLIDQAAEKGVDLTGIQFYIDFFRYGVPPHGGYGFGLTRFIMQLLGLDNVRQATFVYRGINRLIP